MTHQFKLSKRTLKLLSDLSDALTVEVETHREEWESRSARWQEGDRGSATSVWIDEIDDASNALIELRDELSAQPKYE